MQQRTRSHRPAPCLIQLWLPAGDRADALTRQSVIDDAGEQTAQLDSGRELAVLAEGVADRGSLSLGDGEHRWSMGRPALVG